MLALLSPESLFHDAILGGLIVALLCSTLGVYVALRRLVLLGVTLPQAGAMGVAVAFWVTGHGGIAAQHDHAIALTGSLVTTLAALALLIFGGRRGTAPAEWRIGVLFVVVSAATVVFVALNPTGDLEMARLLRGELLAISRGDLTLLSAFTAVIVAVFVFFRRELLLASFDPDFMRTLGMDPNRYDSVLYLVLGSTIALGVMNAGPLVVFGFLVLPPLAALKIARSMAHTWVIALGVSACSSLGGFALAYRWDLPAGPVSVLCAAGFWLLAVAVSRARRSGWRQIASASSLILLLACASDGTGEASGSSSEMVAVLDSLAPERVVSVLPVRNDTGHDLSLPRSNPLSPVPETERPSVTQALRAMIFEQLEDRGVGVRLAQPGGDEAPIGEAGPAVLGARLRRFTLTGSGMLLVDLEFELRAPPTDRPLCRGRLRRPFAARSALDLRDAVADVGPTIVAAALASACPSPLADEKIERSSSGPPLRSDPTSMSRPEFEAMDDEAHESPAPGAGHCLRESRGASHSRAQLIETPTARLREKSGHSASIETIRPFAAPSRPIQRDPAGTSIALLAACDPRSSDFEESGSPPSPMVRSATERSHTTWNPCPITIPSLPARLPREASPSRPRGCPASNRPLRLNTAGPATNGLPSLSSWQPSPTASS